MAVAHRRRAALPRARYAADARQREDAHRHAELRERISDRGNHAQTFRRDGLSARRSGLPVVLSGRFVRVHPGRGQAGPGRRLQRSDHRRQLRRHQGRLAHRQRHHDLRHGERRSRPGTGRPRGSARAGCRPDRRLLAARDHRLRPAWSRQGQGRQVSSPAARLHRRGSEGGLLRPAGDDEQLQHHGSAAWWRTTTRGRRNLIKKHAGLSVEPARQPQSRTRSSRCRAKDRNDSARRHRILGTALRVHQQQPRSRARPLLHGHAQAAGHRERQGVQAGCAATRHPRGRREGWPPDGANAPLPC